MTTLVAIHERLQRSQQVLYANGTCHS